MPLPPKYGDLVYAGVLGKVIGVYMGRPYEGWSKKALEERWGYLDRYVHDDAGVPLVVADDDISGTFTFVRALEDSGRGLETAAADFGDTWLNYLIENKTILWWGGLGMSSEHTAYLRLAEGFRAPDSGSAAKNGRIVSEQIGAQIFIDAIGLALPGDMALAARMAKEAGSVAHDGEAVHAAQVQAALVSGAFTEKNMDVLLDRAVSLIPPRSLVARVHADVRAWAKANADWRKTYDRIEKKYGYRRYGGNCHVVPNHAAMVMAWAHAPASFRQSMAIICTAGWDTDCNAANVGCLMGVLLGLGGIGADYDFQAPMADRVHIPTAEGFRGVTDCLREAEAITRLGYILAGETPPPPPKNGALFHFSKPGALHGFMPETGDDLSRCASAARNMAWPPTADPSGKAAKADKVDKANKAKAAAATPPAAGRVLGWRFEIPAGRRAILATPAMPPASEGGYGMVGTPLVYPGQTVTAKVFAWPVEAVGWSGLPVAPVEASLYVSRAGRAGNARQVIEGPRVVLRPGSTRPVELKLPLKPSGKGDLVNGAWWGFDALGIMLHPPRGGAAGGLALDSVRLDGMADIDFGHALPRIGNKGDPAGWVVDASHCLEGRFSEQPEDHIRLLKNKGLGVMAIGQADWRDYAFSARAYQHLGGGTGILARYQGLRRHVALVYSNESGAIRLVERLRGETVLGEVKVKPWKTDEWHVLGLTVQGGRALASVDGKTIFDADGLRLAHGGIGFTVDTGFSGFRDGRIKPLA